MFLRMENITKTYGDLYANNKVGLTLEKGEILALVGENGAGKTTIMKVLYGLVKADSGDIYINDKKVDITNPRVAIKQGIGMVQQHFMLFDEFTVMGNIVYGQEPKKRLFFDTEKAKQDVIDLGKKYELPLNPDMMLGGMPVGLKQRVEILKVLYQDTDIIIFDEPTAVLTPQEVNELLLTMKSLAKMGKSIIIITHKLNEVMAVADRAVVMRLGEKVGDLLVKDTTIKELSYLMVGRNIPNRVVPKANVGKTVFETKNLSILNKDVAILDDVSINVKQGEIVGIAGVSGNGQSDLVEAIFGLKKSSHGQVFINGKDVTNTTINNVRKNGVALVPEDRNVHGSAAMATLTENAIMGYYHLEGFSKYGVIDYKASDDFTKGLIKEFDVASSSSKQLINSLSGGNVQKLILAREINHKSPFLIVSEPTRGVDIGAMEFIHEQLVQKRNNGDGVLLISSELSEILDLSDRIYVMFEGQIRGEFTRENASKEKIGFLMLGGRADEKVLQNNS